MTSVLCAILAITVISGNGRSSRQDRHRTHEKPTPIQTHRLEDDNITQWGRETPYAKKRIAEKKLELETENLKAAEEEAKAAKADPWEKYLSGKPCDGIFGQRFGAVFAGEEKPNRDGSYAYVPEQQFRALTEYSVKVLPKSRRVYEIVAKGSGKVEDDERDVMISLFEQKFGKTAKGGTLYFPDREGGHRGRKIVITKNRVTATDPELMAELEAERKALADEKAVEAKADADAI